MKGTKVDIPSKLFETLIAGTDFHWLTLTQIYADSLLSPCALVLARAMEAKRRKRSGVTAQKVLLASGVDATDYREAFPALYFLIFRLSTV